MTAPIPPQPIFRADGVTGAERRLKLLCELSFLKLWSYAGVYTDRGKVGQGHGKELCDVLVVFDRHIIIFSDKDVAFQTSADPMVAWQRWHKRAVLEAAHQTRGAERWLREFPDRLFLDRACTQRFPYAIPTGPGVQYHRVVVAHGTADHCRTKWGGGGSLKLIPQLGAASTALFVVGDLDPSRGYVHILDDTTLDVLMQELDTIQDFTRYLTKKVEFVRSGRLLGTSGEEDLLAMYLTQYNAAGEHDFVFPDHPTVLIDKGPYYGFIHSQPYAEKKKAELISYAWDKLIDHFSQNLFSGAFTAASPAVAAAEKSLRLLAAETRFTRRTFGSQLVDFITQEREPGFQGAMRLLQRTEGTGPDYLLVSLPRGVGESDAAYKRRRAIVVRDYTRVWRLQNLTAVDVVGIGLSPKEAPVPGDDLFLYEASAFDEQERVAAVRIQAQTGWLKDGAVWSKIAEVEYPTTGAESQQVADDKVPRHGAAKTPSKRYPGTLRNDRCPCNSGQKYKRCCGR